MSADTHLTFSLTVAEGKRLLAKGVAALPCVRRAMDAGTIVVTRSSTSGYVLEELLGIKVDRTRFVTGKTLPSGHRERGELLSGEMPEMVIREGGIDDGADTDTILAELRTGDVIVKSPNALDHRRGLVGYLIGAATGGTVGRYLGPTHGKHLHFVAPCGLEKQVASDLVEASAMLMKAAESRQGPSLWVTPAEIVSELEAIELLTGANAVQIAAGGIMGAEGAVWIAASGTAEQIAALGALVDEVNGEPDMLEYAQR